MCCLIDHKLRKGAPQKLFLRSFSTSGCLDEAYGATGAVLGPNMAVPRARTRYGRSHLGRFNINGFGDIRVRIKMKGSRPDIGRVMWTCVWQTTRVCELLHAIARRSLIRDGITLSMHRSCKTPRMYEAF
jgi:hypothetical protein